MEYLPTRIENISSIIDYLFSKLLHKYFLLILCRKMFILQIYIVFERFIDKYNEI